MRPLPMTNKNKVVPGPVADLLNKILSISCSFWEHLAKFYVAPPHPK